MGWDGARMAGGMSALARRPVGVLAMMTRAAWPAVHTKDRTSQASPRMVLRQGFLVSPPRHKHKRLPPAEQLPRPAPQPNPHGPPPGPSIYSYVAPRARRKGEPRAPRPAHLHVILAPPIQSVRSRIDATQRRPHFESECERPSQSASLGALSLIRRAPVPTHR